MNRTYIIVLGDTDNRHYHYMLSNMQRLGDSRKILDNVFVLTTDGLLNYENLRDEISGKEMGYCIVISLKNLIAAWNLSPSNSEFLQSFFPIPNGTNE